MAAASAAGSCGWHSLPLSPSITKSRRPPTPEATTGTPEASASTADRPWASKCDGWMTTSAVRRSGATSAIDPRNRTDAPRLWRCHEFPRRRTLVPRMVRHVRPGHQEHGVRRPEAIPRLHQVHHALFAAEAAHEQAHDGAGRDVPLVPEPLPFVRVGRPEPRDVDGVGQKVHAPGRHAGGDRLTLERVRDAGERVGATIRADHRPRQQGGIEKIARRLSLKDHGPPGDGAGRDRRDADPAIVHAADDVVGGLAGHEPAERPTAASATCPTPSARRTARCVRSARRPYLPCRPAPA